MIDLFHFKHSGLGSMLVPCSYFCLRGSCSEKAECGHHVEPLFKLNYVFFYCCDVEKQHSCLTGTSNPPVIYMYCIYIHILMFLWSFLEDNQRVICSCSVIRCFHSGFSKEVGFDREGRIISRAKCPSLIL